MADYKDPENTVLIELLTPDAADELQTLVDTVGQIQSHLIEHQYAGLIKKAKLRGSRR